MQQDKIEVPTIVPVDELGPFIKLQRQPPIDALIDEYWLTHLSGAVHEQMAACVQINASVSIEIESLRTFRPQIN